MPDTVTVSTGNLSATWKDGEFTGSDKLISLLELAAAEHMHEAVNLTATGPIFDITPYSVEGVVAIATLLNLNHDYPVDDGCLPDLPEPPEPTPLRERIEKSGLSANFGRRNRRQANLMSKLRGARNYDDPVRGGTGAQYRTRRAKFGKSLSPFAKHAVHDQQDHNPHKGKVVEVNIRAKGFDRPSGLKSGRARVLSEPRFVRNPDPFKERYEVLVEWLDVDESTRRSEVQGEFDDDGNYVPKFEEVYNFDVGRPGKARQQWIDERFIKADFTKHLPGQHDQQDHNPHKGKGLPPGDRSTSRSWQQDMLDRLREKLQYQMPRGVLEVEKDLFDSFATWASLGEGAEAGEVKHPEVWDAVEWFHEKGVVLADGGGEWSRAAAREALLGVHQAALALEEAGITVVPNTILFQGEGAMLHPRALAWASTTGVMAMTPHMGRVPRFPPPGFKYGENVPFDSYIHEVGHLVDALSDDLHGGDLWDEYGDLPNSLYGNSVRPSSGPADTFMENMRLGLGSRSEYVAEAFSAAFWELGEVSEELRERVWGEALRVSQLFAKGLPVDIGIIICSGLMPPEDEEGPVKKTLGLGNPPPTTEIR